jgi:TonB family protein
MARVLPKRLFPALPHVPLLILICLFSSSPASAQLSNLDEAGKRFAAEFKSLKPRPAVVNVADFSTSDNAYSPQAHYLAWYLSNSLEVRGKSFLRVPDHLQFDKNLAKLRNSSSSTLSLEDLQKVSAQIGGDYIVVGTVEKTGSSFMLELAAVRLSDGTLVDSGTVELRSSEFLDSLSIPLQSPAGQHMNHAGVNGIGMPKCAFTPDSRYTDIARAKKLNGVVILQALISAEGKVERLQLVRMVGFGLDEEAYNTVKMWKCKPAKDQNGIPVDALVPIEVTFRIE